MWCVSKCYNRWSNFCNFIEWDLSTQKTSLEPTPKSITTTSPLFAIATLKRCNASVTSRNALLTGTIRDPATKNPSTGMSSRPTPPFFCPRLPNWSCNIAFWVPQGLFLQSLERSLMPPKPWQRARFYRSRGAPVCKTNSNWMTARTFPTNTVTMIDSTPTSGQEKGSGTRKKPRAWSFRMCRGSTTPNGADFSDPNNPMTSYFNHN